MSRVLKDRFGSDPWILKNIYDSVRFGSVWFSSVFMRFRSLSVWFRSAVSFFSYGSVRFRIRFIYYLHTYIPGIEYNECVYVGRIRFLRKSVLRESENHEPHEWVSQIENHILWISQIENVIAAPCEWMLFVLYHRSYNTIMEITAGKKRENRKRERETGNGAQNQKRRFHRSWLRYISDRPSISAIVPPEYPSVFLFVCYGPVPGT